MKLSLIDTDIFSLFLRHHRQVEENFQAYSQEYQKITLSIINYYEVLAGLRHKDARRQLEYFQQIARDNIILPLTANSCKLASEIYAKLRQQGQPIDNMDILIAAIAIENGLVLVTHNLKHFARIEGLEISDWSL